MGHVFKKLGFLFQNASKPRLFYAIFVHFLDDFGGMNNRYEFNNQIISYSAHSWSYEEFPENA